MAGSAPCGGDARVPIPAEADWQKRDAEQDPCGHCMRAGWEVLLPEKEPGEALQIMDQLGARPLGKCAGALGFVHLRAAGIGGPHA